MEFFNALIGSGLHRSGHAQWGHLINMEQYFVYCRKSTDQEDKQILSLDSQETDSFELADRNGLIKKDAIVLRESKSAKYVGRPLFNEIMTYAN